MPTLTTDGCLLTVLTADVRLSAYDACSVVATDGLSSTTSVRLQCGMPVLTIHIIHLLTVLTADVRLSADDACSVLATDGSSPSTSFILSYLLTVLTADVRLSADDACSVLATDGLSSTTSVRLGCRDAYTDYRWFIYSPFWQQMSGCLQTTPARCSLPMVYPPLRLSNLVWSCSSCWSIRSPETHWMVLSLE